MGKFAEKTFSSRKMEMELNIYFFFFLKDKLKPEEELSHVMSEQSDVKLP